MLGDTSVKYFSVRYYSFWIYFILFLSLFIGVLIYYTFIWQAFASSCGHKCNMHCVVLGYYYFQLLLSLILLLLLLNCVVV
jgi:hypothetical protein